MVDMVDFVSMLKNAWKDKNEGDVIETCPVCKEPRRIYSRVGSGDGSFIAPCYIGCICDEAPEKEVSYRTTGIPPRFQGAESSFTVRGSGYLYGKVRTGKTTAACSVARERLEAGESVRFVTMADVAMHEFSDKDKGSAFIGELSLVDLLIVDDLGKSETSDWAVSLLFTVINNRYNSLKDVIITSNYSLPELQKRLSSSGAPKTAEAITRRIQDMCVPYKFGQQ